MRSLRETFLSEDKRDRPGALFEPEEVWLANRNHGGYLEMMALDVTPTGAHYLLSHFDVPLIDAGAFRLRLGGAFANPFEMTLEEIRARPAVTLPVTMECAGNGRARMEGRNASMPWGELAFGTAEWTGTPLAPLIREAAPRADAVEVSFTGADRGFDSGVAHAFGRSLTLDQIEALDALVVWAMNGEPLLPQHGAPCRLIVPGWYGMASVKWLTEIEALTEPYRGFQQVETYRYRQEAGEDGVPVTEIAVRSLMIPPGVPDWYSRARYLEPGRVTVRGRAWSGAGRRITRVALGVGEDWRDAVLGDRAGDYAWTPWSVDWDAAPGEHVLRCRAWDEAGEEQPLEPVWNLSGFGNNLAQEVRVLVAEGSREAP